MIKNIKKIAAMAIAVASLTAIAAAPAYASDFGLYTAISNSLNPLQEIESLSQVQKIDLQEDIARFGIPANVESALTVAFRPRLRASYSGGTDLFQGLNEKLNCVFKFGVGNCQTAANDADTAGSGAASWFPAASLHNGQGDAFRHCWWSGLMYRHLGQGMATTIAADHEVFNPGPADELAMDSHNNMMGRVSGLQSTSDYGSRNMCLDWARNDVLVTIQ